MKYILFVFWIGLFIQPLPAQQVSDDEYNPQISDPAYSQGEGPAILIDEGHNNFHTMNGRYHPLAKLLSRDGYKVGPYKGDFKLKKLKDCDILIVSNALNKKNVSNWYVPVYSAFTAREIDVIDNWVQEGGSLFLIADHMPMAGAAKDLAGRFGFEFFDGFALDTVSMGPSVFKNTTGTLVEDKITSGRNENEKVREVVTFVGQAFKVPDDANPLLIFDRNHVLALPDTAWVIDKSTKRISIDGWVHLAYKEHGKGRTVVSGEAAMFSAQLAGPDRVKFGMNAENARENYQLLLNIIHWLDGLIE